MSIYSIQQYHKELEKIIHYGGSRKETAIRNAFYNLLNDYASGKDLMLIAEISTKNKAGKIITPDGTIKDSIRNDWGYWESKDESDDINEEIRKKFEKGYPSDNILFEDSQTAVLFQHGEEVVRKDMKDEEALHFILTKFLSYERPEVHDFREAIEKFKEDIPNVTKAIRGIIEAQQLTNVELQKAQAGFLEMAKASINPDISEDDVKEMMIQHILSADIFNTIFDEAHFHQENNIARELNKIIDTFFTGNVRRSTLGSIKHYYDTINARAASIADHHEKQKFLKVVYENFYKGYNPKAADKLGIVYTPNEIVQFMIRSTDYLLHKHFGKTLGDKNVEILDPATGTGTFITDIIDYLPKAKLAHKYKNELHANEVAILPYYIANLNIEYTYKQKMGEYAEFDNLCFVDTLDNTGFHWVGKQGDLFGVSAENTHRIKRQNERKISVVIGNPPYNANQQNENDNNKNRAYPAIDKRIKDTFIKNSTAQKTKMYDMYSRFYRWAMDRLNDNGVIAFITNRSFIHSRTFDGFRKIVQQEFDYAYIIDTKSDVRANPKLSGSKHNVFGIQAGVAVLFLVKSSHKQLKTDPCKIEYVTMEDMWPKEQKLAWFTEHEIKNIEFENVVPDKNNNWINNVENDWDELVPVISKNVKAGKEGIALFQLFTSGIVTARDEWVYDYSPDNLKEKVKFFISQFNIYSKLPNDFNKVIKWSEGLKIKVKAKKGLQPYDTNKIIKVAYRPFINTYYYSDQFLSDRLTRNHFQAFGEDLKTATKAISINLNSKSFFVLASNKPIDLHYTGDSQFIPLFKYDSEQKLVSNVFRSGLDFLQSNYFFEKRIDHENIFHYVYGVLHNPAYRKKYKLNLKREFPRIPLYENFWQWVKWGEELMELHINYEKVEPFPLNILSTEYDLAAGTDFEKFFKPKLKADKQAGVIELDAATRIEGIPPAAWEYKLGNRSALEWILDQYKEKKPCDPTIAEKFNTYKFDDYREQVIDLLQRVCTVSVETVKIVGEMEKEVN